MRFFKSETGDIDTLLITRHAYNEGLEKTAYYEQIDYRYNRIKNSIPDTVIFHFSLNVGANTFEKWEKLDSYTLRNNQKLNNTFYLNNMYYHVKYGLIRYTYPNGKSFELSL